MNYDKDSFLAGLRVGMLLGREYHEKTYLSFISEDSSEFTLENWGTDWDGTLYYSTDASTWNEWDGEMTLNSAGGKLFLRGTGNTHIGVDEGTWSLTSGMRIQCVGNIENLLDWQTVAMGQHPVMAEECFQYLFAFCDSLVTAPELPATTLSDGCYYHMFENCTSLVAAPELPAMTLSEYCYMKMFRGCTSLTTIPGLPATTLAGSCYDNMFQGCTALITAPNLPATILTEYCYLEMFRGCTSLTAAPRLPATTLADACYSGMFRDCTSLATAPALPATTLASYCYEYMFHNCPSIKISTSQDSTYQYPFRIPTSGTGTGAAGALDDMFYGTGGTFKGTPEINTTYYTDHAPVS